MSGTTHNHPQTFVDIVERAMRAKRETPIVANSVTTDWVQPMLTVASGVASKRPPAKKRRPQSKMRKKGPSVNVSADSALTETMTQDPPAVQSQPTRIVLRSYSPEDDTFITRLTQEEIAPIYKASYDSELNMNLVMEYIQTSHTRIVMVEDQVAGYVSVMSDESGRLNVGTVVLGSLYQGKGYGKRIMRQLEHEARALGMVEMETYIQVSNARGQALAKSLGFAEVSSANAKTILMRKSLLPAAPQPPVAG